MHLSITKHNINGNFGQTIVRPILSVIPGNPGSTVDWRILCYLICLVLLIFIKDENNIHIVKESVLCIHSYWDIQCISLKRYSMPSFGQVPFSI